MKLQTFVETSLLEIIRGVTKAQEDLPNPKANGCIAPTIRKSSAPNPSLLLSDRGLPIQSIEFDVLVRVEEGSGTEGGIAIVVGAIGLGSKGKSTNSTTQDSRIKFSVPITFPMSSHDE